MRHLRSLCRMSVVMVNAFFVYRAAHRFRNIMKQHRKAQHLIRSDRAHRMDRVLTYGITVMWISLFFFHHRVKFRQDHLGNPGLIYRAHLLGMRGNQKFDELGLYAFRADPRKIRRKGDDRPSCLFFD